MINVANAITCMRIVLIPFFGYFWLRGHHLLAIWLFAIAGLSDLLDGFVARYFNQQTKLGQVLDPAADKLMLLVSFIVAAAVGAVPVWLAALVIGRDLMLVIGGALFAFVFRGRLDPGRWKPSRIGKYATFMQILTIGVALMHRAAGADTLRPYVGVCVMQAALLTTVAGLQYINAGIRALVSDTVPEGGRA